MNKKYIVIGVVLIITLNIFSNNVYSIITLSNDNISCIDLNEIITQNDMIEKINNFHNGFTANQGQLNSDKVRFYNHDGSLWFTDDGVWFEIRDYFENIDKETDIICRDVIDSAKIFRNFESKEYKRLVLKQEFLGANEVKPVGRKRLTWNSNFFYGNDSTKWCTDVPNFDEVYYKNLYDGIDLRFYWNGKGLKYDYIIYPGADPEKILIRYNGAEQISIDKYGNMIIKTKIIDVIDSNLSIYQEYNGIKHLINGSFSIINKFEYGFSIKSEFNHNEVLIIDPLIEYSTFIGGFEIDRGLGIDIDDSGNAYITGSTYSPNFPSSTGSFDNIFNGTMDVFVCKLNKFGSSLQFSTFIGGNSQEGGIKIKIDSNKNSYITGITNSTDFPVTKGVFDESFNGPTDFYTGDIFLFKLNERGSGLHFSTFIGGKSNEYVHDLIIDSKGNALIIGLTNSTNFPVTPNASFKIYLGGSFDGFALKIISNGSKLGYSTFIGGSNDDRCRGIALDSKGNAFIIGITNSTDFPTSPGVINKSYLGGETDSFLIKLNNNGSGFFFSTYFGGNKIDSARSIELDSLEYPIITGHTNSKNFPIKSNVFNKTLNGLTDLFILKLNQNGSSIVFSILVGGNKYDIGLEIALDQKDSIFITGNTNSSDFPLTINPFDETLNGNNDNILIKLNHNCSKLLYSTYLGGNSYDQGLNIAIDILDNVYITGLTDSSDFPTTPFAYNKTNSGSEDVYVTKIFFQPILNISSLSLSINTTPVNLTYSKLAQYTFEIVIKNSIFQANLETVSLNIDPLSTDIILLWNKANGKFSKLNDPYNYIIIEPSSKAFNNSYSKWIIYFNVTFNWTFPHENLNDVKVIATNTIKLNDWFNVTDFFQVENDLVFNDTLNVYDKENLTIQKNDLIKGGTSLNWTDLTPIYEGTTNIYPPAEEFDVIIWDDDGNKWLDSPESGLPMNITTTTPNKTTNSFNYTINLTGIPPECDKTNQQFTIRIDAENVRFSTEWPGKDVWQKSSEVYTGVTIKDHGGGFVDNKSIMHSISEDNGATWTDWNSTDFIGESESITINDFVKFSDGDDNLIKWCAKDSVGNGPTESEPYRILVDTQPVYFMNPIPLPIHESSTGEVEVGISIIDNTSGVNTSTIKYSISTDAGNYWSSWKSIDGYSNEKNIDIKLNLPFPNGTDNQIRWRAYDIAGNGPTYSDEYAINVNIPTPPIIPEIILVSPLNNSIITTTLVELSWEVINNYHPGIIFDIKLGTTNPPQNFIEQNYTDTKLIVDELQNGETYYWTVIPKLNNIDGSCQSGIWSFTVDIPLPRAILKTPENNSIITSILPTLVWSLEYEDTETVTYDVYFGINKDPPLKYEKSSTTYFAIDTALQDNTTYYWKIIPWIGKYEGFSSEIWSFIVKLKDEIVPKFGIKLELDPNPLEIKPGEVKFVSAIVTNLGELTDNFTITIGDINNTKLTAENYRQDTLEIKPGKNKEFLIMISIKDGTELGFENITITAKSNLAEKYNLNNRDSQVLTIKILEKDFQKEKERGQPNSIFYFSILLLIIILIIISVIIVILVRKKASKKESKVVESQNIQPETSPESIVTPEPEPTVEPLPVATQQQDETMEE